MSEDQFTEVTSQSWFSRIGGAFSGILVGLILFGLAFPLLFWNEGRAVKRHRTLKEGGGSVISINVNERDAANEGKLVHTTGMATTEEMLSDGTFGIEANALRLRRTVEMYQWDEDKDTSSKKKVGGGTRKETTYSYDRVWSEKVIDSSGFRKSAGHQNPGTMPYQSQSWTAKEATLGAFDLPTSFVSRIGAFEGVAVDGEELPAGLAQQVKPSGDGYFIGADPSSPQIGDVRIKVAAVYPQEISVVAAQVNNTFETFTASTGGTINLLETGTHSAEEMFASAQNKNRMLTWGLRAAGVFLMFIGLTLVFKPLSVLADVIPFLGNIVGGATTLIAFLLAAGFSLVTIAIAWITYRPLVSIPLLVVAAVAGVLAAKKAFARKEQPA